MNTGRHLHQRALIALFALVCVAGCGESVEPVSDGTVTVTWEISPRGCTGAGVDRVRVDLEYEAGTRTETFDCGRKHGRVENLRPANYDLQIVGLDEEGGSTFEAGPKEVTVRGGGSTRAPHMRLTAKPAKLEVVWRFANGFVCGANEVSKIKLAVYDADDYKVLGRTFGCTKGRGTVEKVPPGDYLVELRTKGKGASFSGFVEVDAERGQRERLEVVLEQIEE